MTAFAMLRLHDRVCIFADGAAYDVSGKVVGFMSKILPLPEFGAAIVCQGPAFLTRYIAFLLQANIVGFDSLIQALPFIVKRAHDLGTEDLSPMLRAYRIAVAGFSNERQRFESYYILSDENARADTPGLEPWKLHPAPDLCLVGQSEGAARRFGLFPPTDATDYATDHFAFGVRAIAAARCTPSDGSNGHPVGMCGVGGFIETATLGVGSYVSEIVHRWPDRLNEPIDPDDGDLLPASVRYRPAFMLPA